MTESLPRAAGAVVEAARSLGLDLQVREFPEGTRTAQDAANAIGCAVDQIVKSLVFVADTDPVLVLTSGGNRVDVVKVGKQTGSAGVRKADAEEVRAATGYAIGGTPPFGHARDLLAREGRDDLALRVAVEPGGCSGLRYALFFDDRALEGDDRGEVAGVQVVTDKMSAPYLMGASIDYLDTLERSGFTIDNPNAQGSCACGESFH